MMCSQEMQKFNSNNDTKEFWRRRRRRRRRRRGGGGYGKREKEGEVTGEHALWIKPWAWWDKGETKRLRRREPKIA